MRSIKIFFVILPSILLLGSLNGTLHPAHARSCNVVVGGLPVAAGGGCATQTEVISIADDGQSRELATYTMAQSFAGNDKALYSVSVYKRGSNAGSIVCRIGTSANLSSSYTESITITVTTTDSAYFEGTSSLQPTLSAGTWYIVCENGTSTHSIGVNDSNPYASGQYYYGSPSGTFNATDTVAGRDMAIKVKTCD